MNFYKTLLICFVLSCFSPCRGGNSGEKTNSGNFWGHLLSPHNWFRTYKRLDRLDMEMGDVIDCGSHVLLATGSDKVIHIVADGNKAHIAEEPISELSGKKYACVNHGAGPRGAWESVKLARLHKSYFESINRDFFYQLATCNCEHWVNYWADRVEPASLKSSIIRISPDCEVLSLPPSFFQSATDCWWTGCQLDDWAERGCKQYDRWEREAHYCTGGRKFECCKS